MSHKTEFYQKLKKTLEETTTFPTQYLYKFIVPTQGTGKSEISDIFSESTSKITYKESRNGKYTSVSISALMPSAEAVINKYQKAEKIEGIISL